MDGVQVETTTVKSVSGLRSLSGLTNKGGQQILSMDFRITLP